MELSRAGRVAASAVGAILWAGLLLSPCASRAVPPVATNVTALATWPSYATGRAADAHQINEYLYVSLEEGGFQIWNVQNPKEPAVLWSMRFPGSGPVGIRGRFVYVGGSQLHILEVNDPTRPIYLGAWGDWDIRSMVVQGERGYLVGRTGLLIVDLANPAKPVAVSTNEFIVLTNEVPRVLVQDDLAYIVHGTRLRVIDLHDERAPKQIGTFVDGGLFPGLSDIVVRGRVAYVGNSAGFHIIEMGDPTQPTLFLSQQVDSLTLPLKPRLLMKGNYLYVGSQGRLVAFDISEPRIPVRTEQVNLGLADEVYVLLGDPGIRNVRLNTAGDLVIPRGYDGVELVSLTVPAHPRSVGKVISYADVRAVKLWGNHALLLNFPAGVQVLDITTPTKPNLIRTEPLLHSHLRHQPFEAFGSWVYVLGPSGELTWMDFSDLRAAPRRTAQPFIGDRVCNLAASPDYAVVMNYDFGGVTKVFFGKSFAVGQNGPSFINYFNNAEWDVPLRCQLLPAAPRWVTPGAAEWIKNNRLYHVDGEVTVSHLSKESGVVPPHFRDNVEGCYRLVSTTGHRDYIGGEGIRILNTGAPDAPVDWGRIWTNRINGLSAEGRFAVFTDDDGLKVLEARDPKEPHLIGSYGETQMNAVINAGRYALVARGREGLLALDLGEALTAPPHITRDIKTQRVMRGARARFDLGAMGSPPLRYQWFQNSKIIPGETNEFLDIPEVTGAKGGFILAAVRNDGGSAASSQVSLVINEEPFVRVEGVNALGNVFSPNRDLTVRIFAQDDRLIKQLRVYRGLSVYALMNLAPPEQECHREMTIRLREWLGPAELRAEAIDDEGASAFSDPFTIHVTDQPTFFITNPWAVVSEAHSGIYMQIARVNGSGPASLHFETADLSARAVSERGPGHYYAVSQRVDFQAGDETRDVHIRFVDNDVFQADRSFLVRLSQPSAGWTIHLPETRVTIQDDDSPEQAALWTEALPPTPAPSARGSLQVRLEPPSALGKWRFSWETRWHDSGEAISGLVPGNYPTVFLPRSGYLAPQDTVFTIAPGVNEVMTEHYLGVDAGAGNLSMTLLPDAVNHWFEPGRWRPQGSVTGGWLESGVVLTNLPAGTHFVEFKSVPGFAAPAPQWVPVLSAHTVVRKARYALSTAGSGETLRPVADFRSFAEGIKQKLPYAFNGQLFTDVGYASGCVVRPHTVLTAAHAIFSSESLSYVSQVHWFFQRHRGEHEPIPIAWRGSFLFSGYAAARTNDILRDHLDPSEASGTTLSLDVAALYFNEPAGRGGYGGFTVWNSPEDWIEYGSPRLALSYPVENIPEEQVGRLHQLGPERYYFANAGGPLLSSTAVRVHPGSSGGPVCVEGVDTLGHPLYFPSAVQLGGTDRMLIRLIDLDVADLIVRAEHASGGLLDTGGGFIRVENSGIDSGRRGGLLSIRVGPPAATRLGGAWRVSPTNHGELGELVGHTNFSSAVTSLPVVSSEFGLEVRPLTGFVLPTNKLVRVVADANVLLDLGYAVVAPQFVAEPGRGLGLVGTPRTSYRIETRPRAGSEADWRPLVEMTLEAGTNWLPHVSASDATGRVHRAVWLSE